MKKQRSIIKRALKLEINDSYEQWKNTYLRALPESEDIKKFKDNHRNLVNIINQL